MYRGKEIFFRASATDCTDGEFMILSQIIISISSMVLQNCILNNVCKKDLVTGSHVYRFNTLSYAICILLFGIIALSGGSSLFTVILGLVFGIVTALSNYYKMLSLSLGPMHITLLITTSSMIIPTLSGVFFGEKFSIAKLLVVFVLLFFIYLSFEKKNGSRFNKKWLIFCFFAFILQGSIGVLQKIHQSSEHKGEIGGFLFIAFICSLVYSHFRTKSGFKELGFNTRLYIFAPICGLCTFAMNFLNLKLSGLLPSQLFFPVVNGSAIILSSIMSVMLFKEKPTRRQVIGLCGGILSLIAVCLVK